MVRVRTIYGDLLYIGAAVCLLLLLASARLRGLLANTALLACGTIAIALPVGALLGIVIGKIDLPGRRLFGWTMAATLFVPLYVQAAAWNAVLGAGGWIPQALSGGGYANPWLAGWRGAIWIHAMGAVPWIALMTAASLRTVERRLEEESLLDASPFRVLVHVTLRRGLGGLLAGAVWVAIICATEIAVTDLFQIRTFAEEIFTEASLGGLSGESSDLLHSDLAIGVAFVALLVGLLLRLIRAWLPKAAAIAADATWQWRPTRGRGLIAFAAWSLFATTILLPLAGLIWKAGIAVHQRDGHFERSWSVAKLASMIGESPWRGGRAGGQAPLNFKLRSLRSDSPCRRRCGVCGRSRCSTSRRIPSFHHSRRCTIAPYWPRSSCN
jgi:iron(III) transport system permease protein